MISFFLWLIIAPVVLFSFALQPHDLPVVSLGNALIHYLHPSPLQQPLGVREGYFSVHIVGLPANLRNFVFALLVCSNVYISKLATVHPPKFGPYLYKKMIFFLFRKIQ